MDWALAVLVWLGASALTALAFGRWFSIQRKLDEQQASPQDIELLVLQLLADER